jgi:hypothetical protein
VIIPQSAKTGVFFASYGSDAVSVLVKPVPITTVTGKKYKKINFFHILVNFLFWSQSQ